MQGAALFALISSLLGLGSDPACHKKPLPGEFPFILILSSKVNAGHQTEIPSSLSSFRAEIQTVGLFSQLMSPTDPLVCQVTH